MRSSSPFGITMASGRIAGEAFGETLGGEPDGIRDIQHPADDFGARAQHPGVGVGAGDVQKIVVQIEHQGRAGTTRMRRQAVRRRDIGDGEPLGDDDVGLLVEDRFGRRHPDVEAAGDRRVVQRLEQPDIGAGRREADVETFRHDDDAGFGRCAAGRARARAGR